MPVEGHGIDWTALPLEPLNDVNLSWGIQNDAKNLYVTFVSWDARLVQAMRTMGVTLWFDRGEEKRNDFGMHFSGGPALIPQHDEQSPNREYHHLAIMFVKGEQSVPLAENTIARAHWNGQLFRGKCSYE